MSVPKDEKFVSDGRTLQQYYIRKETQFEIDQNGAEVVRYNQEVDTILDIITVTLSSLAENPPQECKWLQMRRHGDPLFNMSGFFRRLRPTTYPTFYKVAAWQVASVRLRGNALMTPEIYLTSEGNLCNCYGILLSFRKITWLSTLDKKTYSDRLIRRGDIDRDSDYLKLNEIIALRESLIATLQKDFNIETKELWLDPEKFVAAKAAKAAELAEAVQKKSHGILRRILGIPNTLS